MATFTDNAGRTWAVSVTVDVVKRVRSLCGVDLCGVIAGDTMTKLADPVTLCDVLYAVCKPDADANGVSDADFGRAMAGDAIANATRALLDEIVLFSPSPRDRENLRTVLTLADRVAEKAATAQAETLAKPETEAAVMKALGLSGS